MHSESSVFPEGIDPRIFFSELSLTHTDIQKRYYSLIKSGKYKEASQLLFDEVETGDVDMDYYGRYAFNIFENRIKAIEDYYHDMPQGKVNPFVYSNTEPQDVPVNTVWIA